MAADTQARAEARAFNRGGRSYADELKNEILKDLENDISWIGPKRMPEITKYITDKYEKVVYKGNE